MDFDALLSGRGKPSRCKGGGVISVEAVADSFQTDTGIKWYVELNFGIIFTAMLHADAPDGQVILLVPGSHERLRSPHRQLP